MPHTRSKSSRRAPEAGMGRRVGSVRAARKATSRQHNASRLMLDAKFQAPRSCCNDVRVTPRTAPVSVTYTREVRLHMGNYSVLAIPSRNPPQNSARKSAVPFDSAVGMDSCPYMLRAGVARAQCSRSFIREKCKIEKSTKSSMYTTPNSLLWVRDAQVTAGSQCGALQR